MIRFGRILRVYDINLIEVIWILEGLYLPIKRKLPIFIILIAVLPLILLAITLYAYLSRDLSHKNMDKLKLLVESESTSLTQIIKSDILQTELMTHEDSVRKLLDSNYVFDKYNSQNSDYEASAEQLLKKVVDSERIKTSFISDRWGQVIAATDASIVGSNVSKNEYFIKALHRNTAITNVFEPNNSMGNIIIIAAPVFDENSDVVGIVVNVMNLEYLRSNVLNVKNGDTGYFYLVDSEGTIISHPDSERIGSKVENSAIKKVVQDIDKYRNQKVMWGTYDYRGAKRNTAYEVLPNVDWIMVASQEVSEATKAASVILIIISVTTAVLIFISVLVSLKFSRLIAVPINTLMKAMKQAADGDLAVKSEIATKDEFGSLSTSFNIMMDKLNLSYEELSSLYEELTATEEELRTQYEELQCNEEALRNSEERYRRALDISNDAVWEWDIKNGKLFASDNWINIVGIDYRDSDDLANEFYRVLHPEDKRRVAEDFRAHIDGITDMLSVEFRLLNNKNEYSWVYAKGKWIRDENGSIVKAAGSISDISERKKAAQKIEHMAYYDQLTGLYNRAFFTNKLDEEIANCKARTTRAAIMYIDLDNFKDINDTLGHEYGDALLKEISYKLGSIKLRGDTIYRLGGDEFAILRTSEEGYKTIEYFAEQALNTIKGNHFVKDKNIFISGSIGVALYPEDGDSPGILLKKADMAMYKAKEKGKNRYQLFHNSMYDALERKLNIEVLLRNALLEDGFRLLYQPQYDIITEKIVGFEALLRLKQEKYGFISPAEFIPIAEESGLIVQIGEWVLKEACRQNYHWKMAGYKYETISVNISSVQIQNKGFLNMVKDVLENVGLLPEYLELEITESILMESVRYGAEVFNELRSIGVKLSLDDFGTGYSSLNYLKAMPMDTLKMDKSFIDGICLNRKEESIAKAIIDMAHIMNLKVIAEGVETKEQLEILVKHSCDRVQGYLFNKPLVAEKVEELLKGFPVV